MKKIVLFSDGTGNSSASPQKTNVWRAYQALDRSAGSGQIAFYDNGVGTSRFTPAAVLGLAFGIGLARNVRQIYGFLCRTYEDGDEIYGFGFSRGAFTIRVVIALIASQGIIDPKRTVDDEDLDRLIKAAYRQFRKEAFTPSLLSFCFGWLRDAINAGWHRMLGRLHYTPCKNRRYICPEEQRSQTKINKETPLIKFVGVWDTVDAYGLPIDEMTRAWDMVVWPLTAKDRNLSKRVARACQALALDEQRKSFEPMLWNEQNRKVRDRRLMQVWFAGVHSDVGGGYPDDTTSYFALNWILDESTKYNGLTYLSERRLLYAGGASGPLHDSRSGFGNFYRYKPRKLEWLGSEKKPGLLNWLKLKLAMSPSLWNWLKNKLNLSDVEKNEVKIAKPIIHHSVFDRIANSGDAYAPINIPSDYAVLSAKKTIVDGAGSAASLPEETKDAERRRQSQRLVWTKVLTRKVLYLATLAAVIYFVIYPYAPFQFFDQFVEEHMKPAVGSFSVAIQAIPDLIGKVPGLGFAETWAGKYNAFPFAFLSGIALIALLIIWSFKVASSLNAEMRIYWRHVSSKQAGAMDSPESGKRKTEDGIFGALRSSWANFLDGDLYRDRVLWTKSIVVEGIALLFFLYLVLALVSRVFLAFSDGSGRVCPDPKKPQMLSSDMTEFPFAFEPDNPCADTGLKLEKKKTYIIKYAISSDWHDGDSDTGIEADANGWVSTPPIMHLATPFRRHLFTHWYQPVARIGNTLFDRYPLRFSVEESRQLCPKLKHGLCTELTPRRTGALYLYLNDAVVFTPETWKRFYRNNKGDAFVQISEKEPAKLGE